MCAQSRHRIGLRHDMIPYSDALQQVLAACSPLPIEDVPLAQSLGRVFAQDVFAQANLPAFDNSAMDGFALASGNATLFSGGEFAVVGSQAAGDGVAASNGEACEIMTGASLPTGLDSVVPVEQIRCSRAMRKAIRCAFACWSTCRLAHMCVCVGRMLRRVTA
ncbi:MAG: hypothetical protein M3R16_03050 [Pseudomonadota bacterium]|nr:hypothetical protein [Pseudomonadota bacterium]